MIETFTEPCVVVVVAPGGPVVVVVVGPDEAPKIFIKIIKLPL